MKKIIKVSRVKSIEEANVLKSLGVDIIGLCVGENYWEIFDDDRFLSIETAYKIINSVENIKFSIEFTSLFELKKMMEFLSPNKISFMEINKFFNEQRDLIRKEIKNFKVLISTLQGEHDTPYDLILPYMEGENTHKESNYLFGIEIMPEYDDSWRQFKEEAHKYPDGLQIAEINELARESNIIISLDFNEDNVLEALEYFPDIYGINFTLSYSIKRVVGIMHIHSFEDTIKILTKIKNAEIN